MAPASDKRAFMILIGATMLIIFSIVYLLQFCRTRIGKSRTEPKDDQASDPLSPSTLSKSQRVSKIASVADAVRMSTLNSRNSMNSYDRNHITGASSSTTNGSMVAYPINPPPSPATRSRRPYRHYKIINQPPPPTPCSTDICDESDSNYTTKSNSNNSNGGATKLSSSSAAACLQYGYDSEPYPPPPTPRSHYHSDARIVPESSCPPSPSSRSSTYFSPLPPPPSPVQSPSRGFT